MADEVGGTKIQRRQPPPQQQQMGQMNQQQQMTPEQQVAYQQQMAYQQQQYIQQQQMASRQSVQNNVIPPQPVVEEPDEQVSAKMVKTVSKVKPSGSKSKFGETIGGNQSFKYALVVVLLFLVLNSKLIWKQLMKLPFMGTVEPSIVALIVNSILAGLIFFLISTFLIPK
jgi:hypothetical protein